MFSRVFLHVTIC